MTPLSFDLAALATQTPCELNVLRHDALPTRVDGAQIGIFENTDDIRFCGFMERINCSGLETQVVFVVLSNFTNKSLKSIRTSIAIASHGAA